MCQLSSARSRQPGASRWRAVSPGRHTSLLGLAMLVVAAVVATPGLAAEPAADRRSMGPLPSLEEDNRSERLDTLPAVPGFEQPAMVTPTAQARPAVATPPSGRPRADGHVIVRPRKDPPAPRRPVMIEDIRRTAFSLEKGN